MRNVVKFALRTALVMFVTASPALADPIPVTAGFLHYVRGPNAIQTAFSGPDFRFEGVGGPPESVFQAYSICMEPVCVPGRILNLFAFWGGERGGGGEINGRPFAVNLVSVSQMDARWSGSLLIPTGFTGGALSAPFTFTANLRLEEAPGFTSLHTLSGAGTATLSFSQPRTDPDFPDALRLNSLHYEFAAASPTPEPTSVLLLATGLAGTWWRVRRR